MNQHEFVLDLIRRLETAGIPFMIVGSLCSVFYSKPRFTEDADLVIDPSPEQLERFLQLLGEDYYVSPEAARDAYRRRSMFNVMDFTGGWKADLIRTKDRPFDREQFQRRRTEEWHGHATPFASPEDVILAKLEWDRITPSERQLQDVLNVLRARWPQLDLDYLRRWAPELGVSQRLEELVRLAAPAAPEER
jgi:hypothetical protein